MTMIAPNPQPDVVRTPGPNDLIESMTGRPYLSCSQLNSYRGCPRRWFYSHVEGLADALSVTYQPGYQARAIQAALRVHFQADEPTGIHP